MVNLNLFAYGRMKMIAIKDHILPAGFLYILKSCRNQCYQSFTEPSKALLASLLPLSLAG